MIATSKKLTALAAALLSLLILLTLCTVPAFAEEAGTTAADTTAAETTTADTTAADETTATGETTAAGTTAAETTVAETTVDTAEESLAAAEREENLTRGLINLGVGAVILIVLVILAIKFRAKIPGWWKALKSECKKISWCSKDKLKKNTFVVIIIILVITLAIAILDFAFTQGMNILGDIFQ